MENNVVKSGQCELVQEEETASAILNPCSMEEEASSTVAVELEEQMRGLNLNNNIRPWQPQNRNCERSQNQQRMGNANMNRNLQPRQQQMRNVNRNHGRFLMPQQWMRNIANMNRNLQPRHQQMRNVNRNRGRLLPPPQWILNRQLGQQQARSVNRDITLQWMEQLLLMAASSINTPPYDYLRPVPTATVTTSITTSSSTVAASESQSQFPTNSTNRNESDSELEPDVMLD